eukprot:s4511_g2.t1
MNALSDGVTPDSATPVEHGSWNARSHKDYSKPPSTVYGNQHAPAEGRQRMFNSRNSRIPGPDCGQPTVPGRKAARKQVGPLDCAPLPGAAPVPAPNAKTSALAMGAHGHGPKKEEEHHGYGRSDMYDAVYLSRPAHPRAQAVEETPKEMWVQRPTVTGWTKVGVPSQTQAFPTSQKLTTYHRGFRMSRFGCKPMDSSTAQDPWPSISAEPNVPGAQPIGPTDAQRKAAEVGDGSLRLWPPSRRDKVATCCCKCRRSPALRGSKGLVSD